MNLEETSSEKLFREEVRSWMASHLCDEYEQLRNAAGFGYPGFDADLAKKWEQQLALGKWIGLGWKKEFGGRELPLSHEIIFHEEYVRCGGPGRIGHIGEHLLAPTLMEYGTALQQERFLPGVLNGTTYWAQGYSEPGAGSDLAAIRTKGEIDPNNGDWVINGQKIWTSWAHEADWIFVLARTEANSERHKGLTLLLVPLDQPGIEIRPIRQITGGSEFNEVFFDNARTEGSLHLGSPGDGWKVAMALLAYERGVSTLGQQAQFKRELGQLIELAKHNGMAKDPIFRQQIASLALGLETLRSHALRVSDPNSDERATSISKYLWSNWRRDLGKLAINVIGLELGSHEQPNHQAINLEQIWLNSKSDTIYAGSNEIQLNIIAERSLKMPRDAR